MIEKVSDQNLDEMAKEASESIHSKVIHLLEILTEVERRKSYAEHAFSSLFQYIVRFLSFSEAQSAVYNCVVKSGVLKISRVKEMIANKEISLVNLSIACRFIRENRQMFASQQSILSFIENFKGLTRFEAGEHLKNVCQETGATLLNRVTQEELRRTMIALTQKTYKDLCQIKVRLKNPEMSDEDLFLYLIGQEFKTYQINEKNKTITPRMKHFLLTRAGFRCEFVSQNGERCQARNHLEVEHIQPVAKGGKNELSNLVIYCRAHNLRSAVREYGVNKIKSSAAGLSSRAPQSHPR